MNAPYLILGSLSLGLCAATVLAEDLPLRGPHHQATQAVTVDSKGVTRTNRFVQIESGLNYLDDSGNWTPTLEQIVVAQGGATAWSGPHKVSFGANLNLQGAVQIQLPEGEVLVSHVHGLAYTDVRTGHSVLIAPTQDSEAWIYPPNELVYHNAFEGVDADVRYRYTRQGIEQDIVLRQRPEIDLATVFPGAEASDLRLEVWTEFTGSPQPNLQSGSRVIESGIDAVTRQPKSLVVGPEETLGFGSMQMERGRTFPVSQSDQTLALVLKNWVNLKGRSFLVEAVDMAALTEALEGLPPGAGDASVRVPASRSQVMLKVPAKRVRPSPGTLPTPKVATREQQVAFFRRPGVVVDYQLVNTSSNVTFRSDTTYYVSGAVSLSGTTTFEGGTVIKFTNSANASLIIEGPVTWLADFYQPVSLTAVDDHSIGEVLGSGVLTNHYADPALDFRSGAGALNLAHLRISNAKRGILLPTSTNHVLSHVQLRDCKLGIYAASADFKLRNALFANVSTNFGGTSSTGRIEHLTSSTADLFSTTGYGSSSLYLTNCLLVAVTATNPFTWQGSSRITSTTGIFQTAGAGQYYLANGSPYRNSGVAGINATLQTQLRKTTTYPPVTLSGTVTVPTTLHPTVQRETDALDAGYHYPALDHLISTLVVTNTTLTLANGVALGFQGANGIWLQPKSSLAGRGLPHQLNVLVRSTAVQESTTSPSPTANDSLLITYSSAGVFADAPSVDLGFTAFIANSPGGYHLYHAGSYQAYSARIQHSQFSGGWFYVNTGAETPAITLNNNVHWRTEYWLQGTLGLSMRHQLNQNGYYDFGATSPSNTWEIIENVFDKTPAGRFGEVMTNFKNAFVGGGSALTATTGTNVFLTAFTYASGALGGWYHGQTNLANNGSRSASAAGLYHFTTTANQSKETNSLVDIGFHLAAVDGSGLPFDTDGDGIPDYVEDADGDGTVSGIESDWLAPPIASGSLRVLTPTLQ